MQAYTRFTIGNASFGRKIANKPKSRKTTPATNKYPPMPVTSIFVWKENIVIERQTTAVIATAKRTALAL